MLDQTHTYHVLVNLKLIRGELTEKLSYNDLKKINLRQEYRGQRNNRRVFLTGVASWIRFGAQNGTKKARKFKYRITCFDVQSHHPNVLSPPLPSATLVSGQSPAIIFDFAHQFLLYSSMPLKLILCLLVKSLILLPFVNLIDYFSIFQNLELQPLLYTKIQVRHMMGT